MQRFIGLFVCVLAALGALSSTSFAAAPARLIQAQDQRKAIADQYIVVLKDGPSINAGSVAQSLGVSPKFTYSAAINGFAARLTPRQLKQLQQHPQVDYIEQDAIIAPEAAPTENEIAPAQTTPSGLWGLDRIDQRNLPLNNTYNATATASNVTVYVIDSGIYTPHMDFGGRATVAYDATGGNGIDCYGMGTHLAGTIGGATHGVAKGVRLRSVRIRDCYGYSSTSYLMAGVDYVRSQSARPAVAIMVLQGSASTAIDSMMLNLYNAGIYVVVHAGNENLNACNYSPARAYQLMTVAAASSTDARASWSNFGACVDLYAPGVSVLSTWYGSYTGTRSATGTEMAAAHAAGVVALYLSTDPTATMPTVTGWLTTNATTNVITGNPSGTPNRLLFKSTL